jgi:NAD-dependent dihydropyrimidine dehydrogenase PreA subunit
MTLIMGCDDAGQRRVLGVRAGWYKAGTRFREEVPLTYVITEPCIGTKDQSCVEVCPVDCIYDAGDHFMINPEECIDCGACEPECPVEAPTTWRATPPRPPTTSSSLQRGSNPFASASAFQLVFAKC